MSDLTPLVCEHGKTATDFCGRCDPLLFWGRLPLATTLWLRDRLRANRAVTAVDDGLVRDDK